MQLSNTLSERGEGYSGKRVLRTKLEIPVFIIKFGSDNFVLVKGHQQQLTTNYIY